MSDIITNKEKEKDVLEINRLELNLEKEIRNLQITEMFGSDQLTKSYTYPIKSDNSVRDLVLKKEDSIYKQDFDEELSLEGYDNEFINNKDLLLVTLLEYICNIHRRPPKIFHLICEYLKTSGIIDMENSYSIKTSYIRNMYMQMMQRLIKDNKTAFDENKQSLQESRYRTDFIEIEKIGNGGFGSVFKAHNKIDSNLYAIKKVYIDKLDKEKSNFYLNEVKILSTLNHPNIVRYFGSWIEFTIMDKSLDEFLEDEYEESLDEENSYEEDEIIKVKKVPSVVPLLYIQMELCRINLEQYLNSRNYRGIAIDIGCEKKIFKQIVNGLYYIHKQDIVHGDLNPKNIFLNDELQVKIGDFGLSKTIDGTKDINVDGYGNMIYMSPEQLEQKIYNKKSDIYSLGLVYLELIQPFKTVLEKIVTIESLKNEEKKKFKDFRQTDLKLLLAMTNKNYKKRPSITVMRNLIKNKVLD